MAIKKRLIPLIPIRGFVIFPKTVFHFDVARKKSIAAVEKAAYEVVITSNTGVTAHQGETVELTATLLLGGEEYTGTIEGYQWYKISNPDVILGSGNKYLINGVEFNQDGYIQYGCKITIPSQGSELNGDQ